MNNEQRAVPSDDSEISKRFWNLSSRRKMILLADIMREIAKRPDYDPLLPHHVPLAFWGGLFHVFYQTDPEKAERGVTEAENAQLEGYEKYLFGHRLPVRNKVQEPTE